MMVRLSAAQSRRNGSPQLAVEQRAYPGTGEPDRMAAGRVEREDEGIAQRAANGPRLDLRALWRRASAAPLFPIGIELAACRVFHENRLPALARLRRIRP
jgi:hypothetical protein